MCNPKFQQIFLVSTLIALAVSVWGQGKRDSNGVFNALTAAVGHQESALGRRVKNEGKEQTIYVGEIEDAQGNRSPAQVLHQLPTLVRLEGFSQGRVLSFDGVRTSGVITKNDETAIEVFTMDMPEGMFASLRDGASLRHLGSGFGPDPRLNPNYKGSRLDIFSVVGPVFGSPNELGTKLYYFDSETGFLQSTRYSDDSKSPPLPKETRFSGWHIVADSAYASRIDHYEGGRLLFSFSAKAITPAKAADKARFR